MDANTPGIQLVVLPAESWRQFTKELILAILNRPGITIDQVRKELSPILNIEAEARYGMPPSSS